MKKEAIINNLIKNEKPDTNLISDGHHTFGELYEHRNTLFITLARILQNRTLKNVWRFQTDKDWFILGIHQQEGRQITYHLPMNKWKETHFAHTHEFKPAWDGHTPKDVLQRLNDMK